MKLKNKLLKIVYGKCPKCGGELEDLKKEVTELKQHIKPEYDLTKREGVIKYLDVSNSTLTH